jgi:hypothetical protein
MTNLIQIRAIIIIILGVGYVVLSQSAIADSCSFTSATGINFGSYDIFDVHTNNNGAGSMSDSNKEANTFMLSSNISLKLLA